MQSERNQVFICYSRGDDQWRVRIQKTLSPLLRNGEVLTWDDQKIVPGSIWRHEIEKALNRTRVALVLASADSLASDFIMNEELSVFVDGAKRGELVLLWVLVSPCLWQATPLASYQAILDPRTPLAALSASTRDAAITKICWKVEQAFRSPLSVHSMPTTTDAD